MNTSQQAQKGFKTFILTLSLSLIVFSVIYYMLNTNPSDKDENYTANAEVHKTTEEVLGAEDEGKTVFGSLIEQKMDVPSKAVLSGVDTGETTESTTAIPDTGSLSVTVGLVTSLGMFMTGLFVIYRDPRKMALLGFEKKLLEDL